MNAVKFREWICVPQFGRYPNNRIAIRLYNANAMKEDGLTYAPRTVPIAVATVNVVDYKQLKPNQVIIKNYSENEGMLDALIDAKIISSPVGMVNTGFVQCAVCDLLIDVEELAK